VLDATWSAIDFPDGADSYTIEEIAYRSLDTTSLEIFVTFEPLAVVAFEPVDGIVDESSINILRNIAPVSLSSRVVSSSSPSYLKKSTASASNSTILRSNSLSPDLIHGINPHRISSSNSWFADGDYFWNYDFYSKRFDLSKRRLAQYHADWPVTVIFTNDASKDLAKRIWGRQWLTTPMNMKMYDGYPRLTGNPFTPTWVGDSGAWTGTLCRGTTWHYRVYALTGSPYGADAMYNLRLGYYVIATTHKDRNERKSYTKGCGNQWWGDAEVVEERLVRDAVNFNATSSDPNDIPYYGIHDQFNVYNRDMRGTIGRRHYRNNGEASQICMSLVDPSTNTCATSDNDQPMT
jgi:hypothetical protein